MERREASDGINGKLSRNLSSGYKVKLMARIYRRTCRRKHVGWRGLGVGGGALPDIDALSNPSAMHPKRNGDSKKKKDLLDVYTFRYNAYGARQDKPIVNGRATRTDASATRSELPVYLKTA